MNIKHLTTYTPNLAFFAYKNPAILNLLTYVRSIFACQQKNITFHQCIQEKKIVKGK